MTSRATWLAASLALAVAACAPTDHGVVLRSLKAQLVEQYHACVPLGWDPVPVFASGFYPGYSTEYIPAVQWLPATWIGTVRTKDLTDPEVRVSYQVLNELVRAGMVERNGMPGGFRYHLTMRALDYYWQRSQYKNNPSGQSYLCYSRIMPQRVLWNQPIHIEKDRDGHSLQVFRAAFEWRAGPDAEWANSAFLRSHSVILAPIESPAVAKFVNVAGDWDIQSIYSPTQALPRVTDASVWPRFRP